MGTPIYMTVHALKHTHVPRQTYTKINIKTIFHRLWNTWKLVGFTYSLQP